MRSGVIIAIVLFCAILAASGQIFFKLSSKSFSMDPTTWIKNPFFISGIILYATSAVLFIWTLKFGNLSVLYPLIATSYIWVSILSVWLLKEDFPLFKWIGVALIMLGILVITR
jgi:uncharacterized membrane protein